MKRPTCKLRLELKEPCRSWYLKEAWKYESTSGIAAEKVR